MKNMAFFLALAMSVSFTSDGQKNFTSVSTATVQGREFILFMLPCEINVRHYRIEASNDNLKFDIIGTIPSKGGSMLAVSYKYDLAGYSYKYYRVGIVKMDATLPYSCSVASVRNAPGTPVNPDAPKLQNVLAKGNGPCASE